MAGLGSKRISNIAVDLGHVFTGGKMRTRFFLNRTGRWASNLFAVVATVCLIALSSSQYGQAAVIFSDGFGSSTVNQTDTNMNVTSTSTSYDPASNKGATFQSPRPAT